MLVCYRRPISRSLLHFSLLTNRYSSLTQPRKYKEEPRINPVGIQYLSHSLQKQIFGNQDSTGSSEQPFSKEEQEMLLKLSRQSLRDHDLLDKKTSLAEPIDFKLPKLQGKTLDEHFQKIGHYASEPYITMAKSKFKKIIQRPKKWIRSPGWTKYEPGKEPRPVLYPEEDTMVFDVETLYKISPYPTLATAVTDKAWYSWCSPYICTDTDFKHLIPLNTLNKESLVIGHNVGYDRARVEEEYNIKPSKAFFLDTLSLHVASSGLCSRQRPVFLQNKKRKQQLRERLESESKLEGDDNDGIVRIDNAMLNTLDEEEDPWLNVSTLNSLKDVAQFHCGITMNKDTRNYFEAEDRNIVIDNFQKLVDYCADDVDATSRVFDKVFPLFLNKCPHPISFGALKSLSSCILPMRSSDWKNYIKTSEDIYQSSKMQIEDKITHIIEDIVKLKDQDNEENVKKIKNDPWLRQLDWTIKPLRLTKKGVPVKRQKLPGYPEWYRSMFPNNQATKPQITLKSRVIPIFFKLSWENYPVFWTKDSGWCFAIPPDLVDDFKSKNYIPACEEAQQVYQENEPESNSNNILFKVPHPDGPDMNCTTLLSKPYIHFFEKKILKSDSKFAHEALQINSSGSYWMSARERIKMQFLVSSQDFPSQFKSLDGRESHDKDKLGIVLPKIIPMGTVTRRAVESTWLTASNAKKNRIGSELKTQIQAPEGYCFVGADVDSEELWIASLVGDSVFNIHGGTPIGWMCLEGTKNEGTDLHTKTANILGCSRNEAKIFNYGRIYGAGVKFAGQLLKRFNPTLTDEEAKSTASKLYENTKGMTRRSKIFEKFWFGGSESVLFNKLESIAEQDIPRTPVLGCSITSSLMKKNLKVNSFLPSRINWAIQSSGVDYLHLLCCSMDYLIAKFNLDARLCLSIHDEIRFLASEKDKYKVAMALQISNIWTRAIFCEQMGIKDLPQNCAFFSAVDFDHVLRKEVDMDCITPSNLEAIPHGFAKDINELLKTPGSQLTDENTEIDISKYPYKPRKQVFAEYNRARTKSFWKYFLKMQVQQDKKKISSLEREYIRNLTAKELSKDTEYGFTDFINDVKMGRRKKLNVMRSTDFMTPFQLDKQHQTAIKKDIDINDMKATKKSKIKCVDLGVKEEPKSHRDFTKFHSLIVDKNTKPISTKKLNTNHINLPNKSNLYDRFYESNK